MIQPLTPEQIAELQHAQRPRSYRVQLGHVQVNVPAENAQDALRRGRQRLCVEFPRLWDLINTTPDARFVITVVEH